MNERSQAQAPPKRLGRLVHICTRKRLGRLVHICTRKRLGRLLHLCTLDRIDGAPDDGRTRPASASRRVP